ncbi:unnamed protein product [Ilex paraguariensis]|uniref:RING-type domain-containing protein n=1 Tax=Ilex paraguariensis TaxID=185542 RepID=A0ABC8UGY7_9AQUA
MLSRKDNGSSCKVRHFDEISYVLFPSNSTITNLSAMEDKDNVMGKLIILLIAVASAGFVVTIYHCITAGNLRSTLHLRHSVPVSPPRIPAPGGEIQSSFENSMAELIPAHKFQRGKASIVGGEDETVCAVCLSEFEEGEELRTLPECLHSFHAPCIDMWFYSHANCPMCRADALRSPLVNLLLDHSLEGSATQQSPNVLPI